MEQLKPCPFCGAPHYDLETGYVNSPDAWWDSGLRGERYGYVMCFSCGVIVKASSLTEAIDKWNTRPEQKPKTYYSFCPKCEERMEKKDQGEER